MMKQQPCATKLSPSKICRLLLVALALKISILGFMMFEPSSFGLTDSPISQIFTLGGQATANAAEGAGAPPAVAPIVPENLGQTPATDPQSRALPGITPKNDPAKSASALPGITPKVDPVKDPSALPSVGDATTPKAEGDSNLSKDSLLRRQEELARREQELRTLEADISAKLEQMTLLENRLSSMIKEAEDLKDAKLRHLIDVMSNMKARSAAEMIQTMDQRIAVKVLAGMRGRQAGEILNFVPPEIAASLTAALTRMQLPFE